MPSLNISYTTVLVLVGLLGLIFLFLLGYTLWTRAKKRYWQRYKQRFRDYFLPMLFEFVEGQSTRSDADKIIRKLTKRTKDLSYFLELLDEMNNLLKGQDRAKLDLLIEQELFLKFYREKLFSFSKQNQLLACVYFENNSSITDRIGARLISISKSGNLKLAYGATKALQASKNMTIRRNALIRFLKRDDISDLMVSELLHYFNGEDSWNQLEISQGLKEIFFDKDILPAKKRIVVLYLAYKNHFEMGGFLLQYLEKLQYSVSKAPLISGLIEALGKLHVKEAAPLIREYMSSNRDNSLRLKCVEALGQLDGEENLTFLAHQLLKSDFSLRKKIIQILTQNTDEGIRLINRFLIANRKFVIHFKQQDNPPDELEHVLRNIYSTARGIQIMLPKNRSLAHA